MRKVDWYIAKIVFQIIRHSEPTVSEFDVQLRLILADEKAWACEKAATIGRMEETTFRNNRGQSVTWKFIGVTEVTLIGELEDTLLVHSESAEPANANEFKKELKQRMAVVGEMTSNVTVSV